MTEELQDTDSLPDVSNRLTFTGEIPSQEDVFPINDLGKKLTILFDGKKEFTHARATWLLELPEFKVDGATVDRSLRQGHVTYLINVAKRGTFHPEWVQIITCTCLEQVGDSPPGTKFRMNGQHTAWMRIHMPEDWLCPVRILEYEAKTVNDMRILYSSIDRGAPRNRGNIINSYLAGTPEYRDMKPVFIRTLASSLPIWVWEDEKQRRKHDADEVAYLMQTKYVEICTKVGSFLQDNGHSRLSRSVVDRSYVVAALMETFSKLPSKAHEFWNVVRDGIGPDVTGLTDPRIKLHNSLRESVMGQSGQVTRSTVKGGKKVVPGEVMYRWCISAWNYWRRGETVTNLRASTSEARPKAK